MKTKSAKTMSEMQKRLAALKAQKEKEEITEKKEQPHAPNAPERSPVSSGVGDHGTRTDEPGQFTRGGTASGAPDIAESINEDSVTKSAPKTTKKKVEPKPRSPKKESTVKKETKVSDEPRIKLPVKRLNGHSLADAIDAMTPEQIEDSGMGVLKAVLHRHAKRSISMMDAIVTVIMKMINEGYEF